MSMIENLIIIITVIALAGMLCIACSVYIQDKNKQKKVADFGYVLLMVTALIFLVYGGFCMVVLLR